MGGSILVIWYSKQYHGLSEINLLISFPIYCHDGFSEDLSLILLFLFFQLSENFLADHFGFG